MAGNVNDPRNVDVVCPYFKRFFGDRKRAIVCEGILPKTETISNFETKEDLAQHLEMCCDKYRYGDCDIADLAEFRRMQKEKDMERAEEACRNEHGREG